MSHKHHYRLDPDCAECDDLREEYAKPEYHEDRPSQIGEETGEGAVESEDKNGRE